MKHARFLMASALAAPVILTPAYANTLTRLIPDLYAGLDVVSRELVGFIPVVMRNANAERAAVGQSVVYPVTPVANVVNITPAMTVPEPTDQSIDYGTIAITKSRAANFGFTGEEQRGLNAGPGYLSLQANMFAQGLRALTNEIESDLATEAYLKASRAHGAAATPFATNTGETAQVRKLLDDNGAPPSDRSLVLDTSAGAAMRTLGQLTKANEAGTIMTLRDGELLNLNGMSIKESAQTKRPANGTNSGSTTNAAGYAIGATVLTLASAGTGTILAGDIITLAGDPNKYVVAIGDADVSNGGTITLAKPGLRQAVVGATLITTFAVTTRNIGLSRNALHLVARAPALPIEGDAAVESMLITDPRSGMTYEIRLYAGYRKMRAEVGIAWGVAGVKSEHMVILQG